MTYICKTVIIPITYYINFIKYFQAFEIIHPLKGSSGVTNQYDKKEKKKKEII